MADPSVVHRRQAWRKELARRRRERRQKLIGAVVGVAVVGSLAYGAYAYSSGDSSDATGHAPARTEQAAPVRVDVGPPRDHEQTTAAARGASGPDVSVGGPGDAGSLPGGGSLAGRVRGAAKGAAGAATAGAGAVPLSAQARSGRRPIVWVQAGHTSPREPGYAIQTGAGAGAFGSEIGFTSNLAPKVIDKLRAAGVDARYTPGLVTPLASRGAVFISLHYDTPEGHSVIGYAVTGGGEDYYHGEGTGTPSQTPYPDSAPHRQATSVSATVSARSHDLANRLSARYRAIFTSANGARSSYGGVQTPTSNPRVMHYYGYYRTRADARVLIECGAGVPDAAFLSRTDLIATAISAGIVDHLRARGLLRR